MKLMPRLRVLKGRLLDRVCELTTYLLFSGDQESQMQFTEASVRRHIRVLESGKSMTKFERKKDWFYSLIREDYESHYCPLHFGYESLTRKSRERYFWLRLEIDRALDDVKILETNSSF